MNAALLPRADLLHLVLEVADRREARALEDHLLLTPAPHTHLIVANSACRVIVPVFTSQPAISESLSLPTNVYTSRHHLASTCFTTQEALTTGMFTTGMKASASSFSYASRPRREQTESNNE